MCRKHSRSMLAKRLLNSGERKTWIEINSRAARHNYEIFRKIVGPKVKLWSVVKSNAYGHGIFTFSQLLNQLSIDGFCVDSLIEGMRLRESGIKKLTLVLGPTVPSLYGEAAARDIAVSVSSFDALKALLASKKPPSFHLKVDTGMHRQGFYIKDIPWILNFLKPKSQNLKANLKGIYTHFASAKDINYPTYTEGQFGKFQKAARLFERAGYRNLIKHCAATGGTLVDKKYHLDAVRVGIGLYGLYPSKELEIQNGILSGKVNLKPILSWRTVITEIKNLKAGDFVGYDLAERVTRPTKMAVLPIGYWHGFPRALSGTGEVLINGKRARVLGRISMDLVSVDATGIKCKIGDQATLIGRDKKDGIKAFDAAQKAGTIHYEFLTRLNPLIERVTV